MMLVALVGGCTPSRSTTPTPQPSEYQFLGIHDFTPGQGRSDPAATSPSTAVTPGVFSTTPPVGH